MKTFIYLWIINNLLLNWTSIAVLKMLLQIWLLGTQPFKVIVNERSPCVHRRHTLLSLLSLLLSLSWTFLLSQLFLSNCCTDLLQILCGCSSNGPLPSQLKLMCYPCFSGNLSLVILCQFWPINSYTFFYKTNGQKSFIFGGPSF